MLQKWEWILKVVSFHGGLATVPATKGSTTAKILVCNSAADKFISEADIKNFRSNLDSLHVIHLSITQEQCTHSPILHLLQTVKFNMH
jgi:hypothetical protein